MATTAARPTPRHAAGLVPRGYAALLGLLAVGAAVGVGHLVAGLVSPPSSPYLAVGDAVVRLSPQWLTEFAKSTFGTADKPVLLGGMAVVIAALAAAAGLLSRRDPRPGVGSVVVLGLAGVVAVYVQPTFAPLDLLAPLAALAAGVVTFRRLHALALRTWPATRANGEPPTRESPTREPGPGEQVSRRRVLAGASAAVGVGALAAGGGGLLLGRGVGDSRAAVTARLSGLTTVRREAPPPPGADFAAELGTTPFVTSNADFYRIDVALRVPRLTASDWSLRVHGLVDRELTVTFDDLLARPLIEKTVTLTCVSNEVGGSLISTARFVGVPLRDLLLEAGVRPGADQVLATSVDGWTAGTPTDVVLEPDRDAMLAVGMNGEALPPEHGFPVRMVVPGLYGFVSATKWISDIELTTFAAASAYWVDRGWSARAPIKTQSRIDLPRGFASVAGRRVTVAGVAWSQPDGVQRVEVRVDGGPWQVAELATAVSGATWRMWRTTFELPPGSHTVQSRATDTRGRTQPEQRADPIPDGATGWPAVIFTTTA